MLKKITLASVIAAFAFSASATPITGDFRTESDLPDISTAGPLVYENLGAAIGAGEELNSSHFVENPSGWGGGVVHLDWDINTNILTLDSQDTWDFQTFSAAITNILFDTAGEIISGVSLLTNDLSDPSFAPTLSFTDNSVLVSYDYTPDFFDFNGGSATFQIETSAVAAVPEPAGLALIGIGFLGMGLARRSRK